MTYCETNLPAGTLDFMTPPRPPFTFDSRYWARKSGAAAVVLTLAATLAACSASSEAGPADSDAQPTAPAIATTPGPSAADQGVDESDTPQESVNAGNYTSDDVGNATLHVDGVEFPDFTGGCEISRQNGKEDVGDLSEGDIVTIIGIDNVQAHEDIAMNYVALDDETFMFRDLVGASGLEEPSAKGQITSLTELGPRTADGSRDIVEVRFAGVLEGGTTLDADVVCELQNAF